MVNGGGEFALGQDYPNRPIRFITPAQPVGSAPEEFRKFMLADLVKWAKLVRESGA